MIIHSREAANDTLELLKKYRPKGIVHCFSGSLETAKEVLKLGCTSASPGRSPSKMPARR